VSDPSENQEPKSSTRGEAAWREQKERIAERNAQARSAGKQRREAYETERGEARRAAERRQMADLLAKQREGRPPSA
jgi:hypothetical protein